MMDRERTARIIPRVHDIAPSPLPAWMDHIPAIKPERRVT
jgi:hypothetical protein